MACLYSSTIIYISLPLFRVFPCVLCIKKALQPSIAAKGFCLLVRLTNYKFCKFLNNSASETAERITQQGFSL